MRVAVYVEAIERLTSQLTDNRTWWRIISEIERGDPSSLLAKVISNLAVCHALGSSQSLLLCPALQNHLRSAGAAKWN